MGSIGRDDTGGGLFLNTLLRIDKEEQFVLDEGASEATPQDIKIKRSPGHLGIIDLVADRAGRFGIVIDRTAKLVGTAAGYRIDAGAGEATLPYVIRGHIHLDLVDGIQGDRLGIGLPTQGTGKTE